MFPNYASQYTHRRLAIAGLYPVHRLVVAQQTLKSALENCCMPWFVNILKSTTGEAGERSNKMYFCNRQLFCPSVAVFSTKQSSVWSNAQQNSHPCGCTLNKTVTSVAVCSLKQSPLCSTLNKTVTCVTVWSTKPSPV